MLRTITDRRVRRTMIALVLATGATLAAAGCSGSSSDAGSPTPSATNGSSASSDAVAWAGDVCDATSQVKTSVAGIASAAAAGVASGDAQKQVEAQAAQVRSSLESLASTVGNPPKGTDDAVTQSLQTTTDSLQRSGRQLQASLEQLQSANGALDTATGLAAVAAAARATLGDLQQTVSTVGQALDDKSSALGQAFASAPSCVALRNAST